MSWPCTRRDAACPSRFMRCLRPLLLALAALSFGCFAQAQASGPASAQGDVAPPDETITVLPEVVTTARPLADDEEEQAPTGLAEERTADMPQARPGADPEMTTQPASTVTRVGETVSGDTATAMLESPIPLAELDEIGVRAFWNIPYAGLQEPRHRLDLYVPRQTAAAPLPVIVFFHGGDWTRGDKLDNPRRLLPFVRGGDYALVLANYRLAADAQWPAQIEDAKAVIRWIRASGARYGLDAARIGVWGEDAGGHLAMLLGTTADVAELSGRFGRLGADVRIQAVVSFGGYADLPALIGAPGRIDHDAPHSAVARMLGDRPSALPEQARQASPAHWVSRDDAPTLLVHGTLDRIVPVEQSTRMHDALRAAGVASESVEVLSAGHGNIGNAADDHVRAFFDRHLRGKQSGLPSREIRGWRP